MKRAFGRPERDAVDGEVAKISREHERPVVTARKSDCAPVGEIHPRRPSFDLVEHGRYPIRAERNDVHSSNQATQCTNGHRMILQPVLGPRARRFRRDEPSGRAEHPLGPRMIEVAPIDGGLN